MRQCTFDSIPDAARCPRYKDVADPPTFLVIHLFSGRRRKDDFHDALKTIAAQSCWQVIVLSMDTAVSLEYGNLMIGAPSWSSLIALYMAGRVSATLCGPPCETFSEARFTEAPDGVSRWPRPLRSMSRLFGLEDLTMRELRQCAVGSSFFLQCVCGCFVSTLPMVASSLRNIQPFLMTLRDQVFGLARSSSSFFSCPIYICIM